MCYKVVCTVAIWLFVSCVFLRIFSAVHVRVWHVCRLWSMYEEFGTGTWAELGSSPYVGLRMWDPGFNIVLIHGIFAYPSLCVFIHCLSVPYLRLSIAYPSLMSAYPLLICPWILLIHCLSVPDARSLSVKLRLHEPEPNVQEAGHCQKAWQSILHYIFL